MEDKAQEHVPTTSTRMQVCIRSHAQWDNKMIARDLKISVQCLKKHYRDELRNGTDLVQKYARALFIEKAIEKGSVASLRKISEEGDAEKVGEPKASEKTKKSPAVGVKQQRQEEAAKIAAPGNVFQTPEPPVAGRRMNGTH